MVVKTMSEDDQPERRRNGFTHPLHVFQVLSWLVFGTDVIVFAACGLPLVSDDGLRLTLAVLFALSVVVLVAAASFTTFCDPVDPNVLLPSDKAAEEANNRIFCGYCDTWVHE